MARAGGWRVVWTAVVRPQDRSEGVLQKKLRVMSECRSVRRLRHRAARKTTRAAARPGGDRAVAPTPKRKGMHHAEYRPPAPRHRRRAGEGLSGRSEEHTSELQSLMRNSYAVF